MGVGVFLGFKGFRGLGFRGLRLSEVYDVGLRRLILRVDRVYWAFIG